MIDCGLLDERNTRPDHIKSYARAYLQQSLDCGPTRLGVSIDVSDVDASASQGDRYLQSPVRHISLPVLQCLVSISKEEMSKNRSDETPMCLTIQDLNPDEKAYACYQERSESLLQGGCPTIAQMGITQYGMEKFRSRYATAPYLCRLPRCPRSTQSFHAPVERAKHEHSHAQPFRCPRPTCEFAEDGLPSRAALRRHVQMYHEQQHEMTIPRLTLSKQNVRTFDRVTSRFAGTQPLEPGF